MTDALDLDDCQAGALHERPSPYVGTYVLLRVNNRQDDRDLIRRLIPLLLPARSVLDRTPSAWMTVAFTYRGLKALGVPQESLDSFVSEFRQGMAARAAELGDVGESGPDHWEEPLGRPGRAYRARHARP
jgi:deferrochelatase/peroxidase EfeB